MALAKGYKQMSADDLRAWRRRYGYTREQLAEETRVSLRAIENYEQGQRKIPPTFEKTLALIIKLRKLSA